MTLENKENTTSTEEEKINALARKFRHIGYAFFGGFTLLLAVFLSYSALVACANDDVIDPLTGDHITGDGQIVVPEQTKSDK